MNHLMQCYDGKRFVMGKRMRLGPGSVEADWDLVEGQLWTGRERDKLATGRLAEEFPAEWSQDSP